MGQPEISSCYLEQHRVYNFQLFLKFAIYFFFGCVYSQVTEIREREAAVKEELLSISSKFINSKEEMINNTL